MIKILKNRKIGVIGTAVLMLLPLAVIICFFKDAMFLFRGPYHVLSGDLFKSSWDITPPHIRTGRIFIHYFWFTLLAIVWLPYTAVVRIICARNTRLRYWVFVIPVAVLFVFLFCLLTVAFYWLILYVNAMGWTERRFFGIIYGIFGYVVLSGVVFWACKIPKNRDGVNIEVNPKDD